MKNTAIPAKRPPIYCNLFVLVVTITVHSNGAAQNQDLLFLSGFERGQQNSCANDEDRDGLVDCIETGTNLFISTSNTGTSRVDPDTDRDGITDRDEVLPLDSGLNLVAMGAHPLRKTIFVEHDWMSPNSRCALGHAPPGSMYQAVSVAFANAPLANPDGSNGVTVIHDYGQGGSFTGGNRIDDSDGHIQGYASDQDFQSRKSTNFDPRRRGYFHYIIHAYSHGNTLDRLSSGVSDGADDAIVSLRCRQEPHFHSHTLMHELGHNLGLGHGGAGTDWCMYKPNYNSIMNYRYQFPGIDANCDGTGDLALSFSIGNRREINEASINENLGLCTTTQRAIDFNNNGQIQSSVSLDTQTWIPPGAWGWVIDNQEQIAACGGILTHQRDHNDWNNLDFGRIRLVATNNEVFIPMPPSASVTPCPAPPL